MSRGATPLQCSPSHGSRGDQCDASMHSGGWRRSRLGALLLVASLLLVVRPGAPLVASLLLVAMPFVTFVASLLLVVCWLYFKGRLFRLQSFLLSLGEQRNELSFCSSLPALNSPYCSTIITIIIILRLKT